MIIIVLILSTICVNIQSSDAVYLDQCEVMLHKDDQTIRHDENVTGIAGELNQIYCTVKCVSRTIITFITWYKDNTPIETSSGRVYYVREPFRRTAILKIGNMLKTDEGRYTCGAKTTLRKSRNIAKSFNLIYVCSGAQFQCDDGRCINVTQTCDRKLKCNAGEADHSCARPCFATMVKCLNNTCVKTEQVCVGANKCFLTDYQKNCTLQCFGKLFQCLNGCINALQDCNGVNDSIPEDAVKCSDTRYKCLNSTCINTTQVCDGAKDCFLGDDETNCTCALGQFRCHNGRCISNSVVCDNSPDCQNGEDESSCNASICPEGKLICADQTGCFLKTQRCDGNKDCADSSDEISC